MKYRILLGLLLCCFAFVATAASQWQLNKGYYIPAKMSMTVVFPRPDREVSSGARQKWAFADGIMQYRIPIAIQGGAYPFYVSSSSGLPSGMTINSDPNSPDYMKIIWIPAKGDTSTYNCSVVINDQDGNSVTVTWTVTAVGDDGSHFIFIDPKASQSGSGTKASPLNSMSSIGVSSSSGSKSPYAGKIIVLRAGTTAFHAFEADGIGYDMMPSTQNPYVFLGYTGETAKIDMSTGAFKNFAQPDAFFGQVTLTNARTAGIPLSGESDSLFYFDWGATNRTTFFENAFDNIHWLGGGASNQAAVVFFNPSVLRNYLTIVGNTMTNSSVAMVDTFAWKYAVVDDNTFGSGSSGQMGGFYLKSDIQYFSVRKNAALSASFGRGLIHIEGQAQIFPNDYLEVCYNASLIGATSFAMRSLLDSAPLDKGFGNVFVYRNTFLGGSNNSNGNYGTITKENNVMISNNGDYGTSSVGNLTVIATDIAQGSQTGNLYGTTSDGFIDQYGMLTGAATKYIGRVGHLISNGTPLLNAPAWIP